MAKLPLRKCRLELHFGADSRDRLIEALQGFILDMELEESATAERYCGSRGCPSYGGLYKYSEDGLEHDEYHKQLDDYLKERKEKKREKSV